MFYLFYLFYFIFYLFFFFFCDFVLHVRRLYIHAAEKRDANSEDPFAQSGQDLYCSPK